MPKYGAGLYLYSMPLGGDGLMGMLGIAGLFIALVAILGWALEAFPPRAGTAHGRTTPPHGFQEHSHG